MSSTRRTDQAFAAMRALDAPILSALVELVASPVEVCLLRAAAGRDKRICVYPVGADHLCFEADSLAGAPRSSLDLTSCSPDEACGVRTVFGFDTSASVRVRDFCRLIRVLDATGGFGRCCESDSALRIKPRCAAANAA